MAEKISIVYIGPKAEKKDTVCGTRLKFKRFDPVSVESDIASRFLDFPEVWVKESEVDEIKKKLEAKAEAEEEARKAAEEAAKRAEADANMVVIVDGEEVDLGKYSSKQLDTFVVAHELEVEGPKKPVNDYRKNVRDAFRALTSEEGNKE